MKKYEYCSTLKKEMYEYIDLRKAQGLQVRKTEYVLETIDKHLTVCQLSEKKLSIQIIDGWLNNFEESLSKRTVATYISQFRQFAKYLSTLKIDVFEPEFPICRNSYTPYIFTEEEMKSIFKAADNLNSRHKKSNFQFPMLIRILYGTGARLGEVLHLMLSDIDLSKGIILVRKGKGNKDRLIPLDASLTDTMSRYCAIINDGSGNALLFEGYSNKPRTKTWAETMFERTLKAAGIRKFDLPKFGRNICLNCIRHTFAVDSLRKQDVLGIDNYREVPSLSTYMGHVKLMGTEKYLHMNTKNSEDIYAAMSGYAKAIFPEVAYEE
jgi:integrase